MSSRGPPRRRGGYRISRLQRYCYTNDVFLAAEGGDSISRISEKIGASYTHKWIERLEDAGVVKRDGGVRIVDQAFADAFHTVAEEVVARGLTGEDAYMLPTSSGWRTGTRRWTRC